MVAGSQWMVVVQARLPWHSMGSGSERQAAKMIMMNIAETVIKICLAIQWPIRDLRRTNSVK